MSDWKVKDDLFGDGIIKTTTTKHLDEAFQPIPGITPGKEPPPPPPPPPGQKGE
jgi:hypothetical protein